MIILLKNLNHDFILKNIYYGSSKLVIQYKCQKCNYKFYKFNNYIYFFDENKNIKTFSNLILLHFADIAVEIDLYLNIYICVKNRRKALTEFKLLTCNEVFIKNIIE